MLNQCNHCNKQNYCSPKPKIKGYKKKLYPQNGLDSSQLLKINQNETFKNLATTWNTTNKDFYTYGLDNMNITANYNFTYWDGYKWKKNNNYLRQYRSVPWTTYPCENCLENSSYISILKDRECKSFTP